MAEGREEDNWNKSKAAYDEVQRAIVRAEQLELYADVPRLLPDEAKPQCLEQVMEIVEYSRQNSRNHSMANGNGSPPAKKAPKRKRNDDVDRNAPEGVAKGFQSVGEMLRSAKGKSKTKKSNPLDPNAGTDDDTDREIEAGIFGPRRTTNTEPEAGPSTTKKGKKRKSDTGETKIKAPKFAKKTPVSSKKGVKKKGVIIDPPSVSQRGQDDSDDEAIMHGLDDSIKKPPRKRTTKRQRVSGIVEGVSSDSEEDHLRWDPRKQSPQPRHRSPSFADDDVLAASPRHPRGASLPVEDVIDISSRDSPTRSPSPLGKPFHRSSYQPASPSTKPTTPSPARSHTRLSPCQFSRSPSRPRNTCSERESNPEPPRKEIVDPPDNKPNAPSANDQDTTLDWLLSDEDADEALEINDTTQYEDDFADVDFLEIDSSPAPAREPEGSNTAAVMETMLSPALSVPRASSPCSPIRGSIAEAMPPPSIPARFTTTVSVPDTPEPSFPVGRGVGARKRPILPDSSPLEPSISQHGLHRLQRERQEPDSPSSPLIQRPAKRLKRRRPNAAVLRAFVEDEAGHSGEEVSEGTSGEDEPESESDRRFLRAPPETQIPEGYAQTQIYRESLLSQAPNRRGPVFAARPVVRGKFGPQHTHRRLAARGSSPATELGSEPDEYSMGSFVVHDDDEIVYEEDSSQLQI
jgi:ATP-dependent DNA helicase MPH1